MIERKMQPELTIRSLWRICFDFQQILPNKTKTSVWTVLGECLSGGFRSLYSRYLIIEPSVQVRRRENKCLPSVLCLNSSTCDYTFFPTQACTLHLCRVLCDQRNACYTG